MAVEPLLHEAASHSTIEVAPDSFYALQYAQFQAPAQQQALADQTNRLVGCMAREFLDAGAMAARASTSDRPAEDLARCTFWLVEPEPGPGPAAAPTALDVADELLAALSAEQAAAPSARDRAIASLVGRRQCKCKNQCLPPVVASADGRAVVELHEEVLAMPVAPRCVRSLPCRLPWPPQSPRRLPPPRARARALPRPARPRALSLSHTPAARGLHVVTCALALQHGAVLPPKGQRAQGRHRRHPGRAVPRQALPRGGVPRGGGFPVQVLPCGPHVRAALPPQRPPARRAGGCRSDVPAPPRQAGQEAGNG